MKTLSVVLVGFICGCSSHRHLEVSKPAVPTKIENVPGDLRTPEIVATYHLGRYVDPANPDRMMEAHPVYRVEESSHWRLAGARTLPTNAVVYPAASPAPLSTPLPAESAAQHQKEVAHRVLSQIERMSRSLAHLGLAITNTTAVLRQQGQLKDELKTISQRLERLESDVRGEATNSTASPAPQ